MPRSLPPISKPSPRPVFDCECGDHVWTAATRGLLVFASPEDRHLIERYRWCAKGRGKGSYANTTSNNKAVLLHRLILSPEAGMFVDHINGCGHDNRRSNLRPCTTQQNSANKRASIGSLSKFKGVTFDSQKNRWKASIKCSGRNRHLGYFTHQEDAARAYDAAAIATWGEYARTNFPGREKNNG